MLDEIADRLNQLNVATNSWEPTPNPLFTENAAPCNVQDLISRFKELTKQPEELDVNSVLELAIQVIGTLSKQNEQQRLIEKRLNLFLKSLPLAAYSWDVNNIITDLNPAAAKLFGYEAHEAIGKNCIELLVPPEHRTLVSGIIAQAQLYPEGLHQQNVKLTKDGRRISCEWVNFPLFDTEGRYIGCTAVVQDISVKEQFQESEARRRYFWENMPDGIAEISLEGKILLANHVFYANFQQPESSTNLLDLVPNERRAALRQVVNKVKQTRAPQLFELPLADEHQLKWWSNRIIPIIKNDEVASLLVVSSDVTERKMAYQKIEQQVQERTQVLLKINQELKDEIYTRKQIEASLRESESRYYRLTAICPVGIFRGDAKGRTIYMNERCAEIVGLPLHEALGYGWAKTIHPDDYDRAMRETYHAWEHQIAYKTKLRHLHPDGTVVWVIAEFLNEKDEHGNFKGFVGTLTDVTRLMQAEERLHQHQFELEHGARINMIGEMISGIAHEINQPLAMIVNYTGGCLEYMRREKNISPQIITMMQRAFDQAERAGKIIHRLKEFLKKGTLEKESIDINFVIKDAISLVAGVLQDAKIELKMDLCYDLALVFIDKIQIEQVILNLIHNAVEAMNAADWLFRQITIQTCLSPTNPNQIELRISDTGPGIPNEIKDHIFDAFFTTKEKGMGVGLSISATILEVHGGRISLDRDYKEGTSFKIVLPIEDRSISHAE